MYQEQMESRIQKVLTEHDFQGTVLVSRSGQVVLEAGYGLANLEWGVQNTADTKFIIASLTKQFTSMLIMILQEQGMVGLESHLSSHLPWYCRDTGERVTIHHLLTHTSGIPNYTDLPGFMETALRKSFTSREFIEQYCSGDLRFEPGTAYEYSNSGYYLLGAVIEAVTGKSYAQALDDLILKPLGMHDTGYYQPDDLLQKRADGYIPTTTSHTKAPFIDSSVIYAAGAMYSTVRDLFIWDQSFYQHKLISEESTKLVFTPGKGNYGYGWGVATAATSEVKDFLANPASFSTGHPEQARLMARHEGGHPGYHSLILREMAGRHLVVLLSNYVGYNLGAIAAGILEIVSN